MSVTASGSRAPSLRSSRAPAAHLPYSPPAAAAVVAVAGLAVLFLAYLVSHHHVPWALLAIGAPFLFAFLVRRQGTGFLAAVGVLLLIPYWYPHVWLLAPILAGVGLLAGVSRVRLHPVDAIFGLVALVFAASWIFHPELHLSLKRFIEGMLPFTFYIWARLALDQRTLPRLQLVMLVAGAVAACTVLFEAARGSPVFVDPLTYQWAGSATNVFRAGGIFGGAPTAATVLAVVFFATIPVHQQHPKLARVCAALILAGIIVTLDRAGYFGLIAGALLFATILPYRRWLRVAGVAVILLVAALVVTNAPTATRSIGHSKLVTAGIIRSNTISYRARLLSDSLPLIDDSTSHLLFGRGFDAFEALSGRHDVNMAAATDLWVHQNGPNDDYVRALLEQGLVGLLVVVAWLVGSLAVGVRACLRAPSGSADRTTLAALSAAALCYVAASTGHDMAHNIAALSTGALITGTVVSAAALPRVRSARARIGGDVTAPAVTSWRRAERPAAS